MGRRKKVVKKVFIPSRLCKEPRNCMYTIKITYKRQALYKIGFTAQLDARMEQIKENLKEVGMPHRITILKVDYREDAYIEEQKYHSGRRNEQACIKEPLPFALKGRSEFYRSL